jgi:hypothetical protein
MIDGVKANAEDLSIDHKWQSRKVKSLHQSTFFLYSLRIMEPAKAEVLGA